MSDPTPPTALPPRPAARRRSPTRAAQLARFAADGEAITEAATAAARRVINASFGSVPDTGVPADPAEDSGARLYVHVSCAVDGTRPRAAQTEPPRGIDIAVTVRIAEPTSPMRRRPPDAKAA